MHFVIYQHYTLMPLLSDRDYAISGIWDVTHNEAHTSVQSATLDLQSVSHEQLSLIEQLESREDMFKRS